MEHQLQEQVVVEVQEIVDQFQMDLLHLEVVELVELLVETMELQEQITLEVGVEEHLVKVHLVVMIIVVQVVLV
tara:strand:+ start:479 stop:700 length:222 start_codon:yes stop_codon:yes gene_type:complete